MVRRSVLTTACWVFAGIFAYGSILESVLSAWLAVMLVAGGSYSAVIGVLEIVDPFGPICQRVFNFVSALGLLLPGLFYSYKFVTAFAFGVSVVLFGILLQDTVSNTVKRDDT